MFAQSYFFACAYLSQLATAFTPESSIVTDSVDEVVTNWAPATSWQHAQPNGSLIEHVVEPLDEETRVRIRASLPSFISSVRPMFAGTPKNEFGLLGHSATRYTLNRLFVQRHGWFVNGLYAGMGTKLLNETSTTDALLQYVPTKAQHAFERRLSGRGLDEQDIALLAATIETVIFEDAVQELRVSFNLTNTRITQKLSKKALDNILEFHMAMRVTGLNKQPPRPEMYEYDWKAQALETYPRWPFTVKFLHQLREELFPNKTMFGFRAAALVVREIESRWARMTAVEECQVLKTNLVALEEGSNTGCVRLSDFYNRSLDPIDGWQFTESPAYLQQLGALDSSDPSNPRLIIPNYINSPGNCVPSSKYYMACCISECASLTTEVEGALQKPEGSPEEIARIVKKMLFAETKTFGALPSALLQRLIEIGEHHDGLVPIQSRLFSQWMHFVYPQKCPFPHLAGTTSDQAPDLYSASQMADRETINHFIDAGRNQTRNARLGTCMAWRSDEEIFVPTFKPQTTTLEALEKDESVWASMYFVAVLMSVSLYLAKLLQSVWSTKSAKLVEPAAILV